MYQITTHLESRFPTCPLAIGTKLHEWCSSTRWFCCCSSISSCRGSRMGCELAWFIVGFHQLLLLGRHDRHCKRRLSRPMFLDCIESGIPAVSAAFFGRVKKITQRIGWVGSFRWGHDERIASWRPSSISQPWETSPSQSKSRQRVPNPCELLLNMQWMSQCFEEVIFSLRWVSPEHFDTHMLTRKPHKKTVAKANYVLPFSTPKSHKHRSYATSAGCKGSMRSRGASWGGY